jgi:hypothetical protein
MTGTLHEVNIYINNISPILLRTRNVFYTLVQKIKTYFMFNKFFKKNRAVFKTSWENVVEPYGPQVYVHYIPDN